MADLNGNNNTLNGVLEKVRELPSVQYSYGIFNVDENGQFNLNCGFQPDIIVIKIGEPYYSDMAGNYIESVYTAEFIGSQLPREGVIYSAEGETYGWPFAHIGINQESYGAVGVVVWTNYSWEYTAAEMQLPYLAIKFT